MLILSAGTLFRASQFLSEELPIRLAHRVQELETLPDGLSEMPSVKKVHDWYAQSFEVCRMSRALPLQTLSKFMVTHMPRWWNRRSPTSHDRNSLPTCANV